MTEKKETIFSDNTIAFKTVLRCLSTALADSTTSGEEFKRICPFLSNCPLSPMCDEIYDHLGVAEYGVEGGQIINNYTDDTPATKTKKLSLVTLSTKESADGKN